MGKIVIPLNNGFKLVAEQNTDSQFNKEIFIGLETQSGVYWQDLAIIRPSYSFEGEDVVFGSNEFEMLIFGDADNEDYTHTFTVPLHKEDDE